MRAGHDAPLRAAQWAWAAQRRSAPPFVVVPGGARGATRACEPVRRRSSPARATCRRSEALPIVTSAPCESSECVGVRVACETIADDPLVSHTRVNIVPSASIGEHFGAV